MRLSIQQGISNKWPVLLFVVGCVLGYGAGFLSARKTSFPKGVVTETKDEDGDGKIDYVYISSNGLPQSTALDRNKDGQYDFREYYMNGGVDKSEADNDFDGLFDEWSKFYHGLIATVEADADGDGRVDIFTSYTNGIVSYSTIRMTKGKGDFFTEYFQHGIRSRVVIMKDGKTRIISCGKYGQIELDF